MAQRPTFQSLPADYITPQELSIKCIRAGNGGEFKGEFQRELLYRSSITHEHTPPNTLQHGGVTERALGLLREKVIAVMQELDDMNVPREKLWAQAMLFACDVTNKSATTSTAEGKSPYELWFGKAPVPDHLRPFEAVGYARRSVSEHKMTSRGNKCAFMGIPRNFPSGTVIVLLVKTREIVERQAVQWVDGLDKAGSMGISDEDLAVKPSENESVALERTPQIDVQKLESEEQPASQEHKQEMQEALSNSEEKTQEAPSSSEEQSREVPLDPEEETREAPSDHEEEAKVAVGPTELEGPVVPALRKVTISGHRPPILLSYTRSRRVHTGAKRAALQSTLATTKGDGEEDYEESTSGDEESTSVCDGEGPMTLQVKADIQQWIAGDISPEPNNRMKAMNALEREEWREFGEIRNSRWLDRMISSWLGSWWFTRER